MRILLASSEVHPYSKTGGLADMVGALGRALAKAGHEVAIVTPFYWTIMERFPGVEKLDWKFNIALGPRRLRARMWSLKAGPRETVYFVDHPDFFHRAHLYQRDGVDYPDNAARFIFFSKCVARVARDLPVQPDIVHTHDWQAGLTPLFIQDQRRHHGWSHVPKTCFTVHNLAYQGVFPALDYELTNLPWDYFQPEGVEFYGSLNCLKSGIVCSDAITTVSPRYAREITTPEYGCGLDGVIRRRQTALRGVLNGVDYEEWNTGHNKFLPHPYSAGDLGGKALDKLELQKELGLPVNPDVPLFASVTRLADQKGVDIQLSALEEMLAAEMQFVLLGSGAPAYERAYRNLAARYPTRAAVFIGFDQPLSHRIEAAADFFLMPSRFEPCGLNQMYSLRYGAVPIVRITGGLDDTVIDATEDAEHANGIKFTEYSARALAKAIRKALVLYREPELMLRYRQNGMAADFSWDTLVKQYADIYTSAQIIPQAV